ncbi:MAG: hypothetical protein ACR2JF_05000 [Iamia sp.]
MGDAQVLASFARDEVAGHSRRLHVEADVLLVDVLEVLALRLTPRTVLVRRDLSEEARAFWPELERALAASGSVCLDECSLLGVPVALQVVGLRLSEWDLWGDDIDDAFAVLRSIATGDASGPVGGG